MIDADDDFHVPSDDVWWFESFWFSFFVPERRLMVYVYPWFRPVLGTCGGGVLAWDDLAAEPWNIVHCDYAWHLPCPATAALWDAGTLRTPQGIAITPTAPRRDFRIVYSHPKLSLDVTFSATQEANVATRPIGGSQLFAGRIDQCGRVTGSLVVDGDQLDVDCHSMRDRSWGSRRDDSYTMNIGYFHATAGPGDAFLAVSDQNRCENDRAPIVAGYLMQDGVSSSLASGHCRLQRDAGGVPQSCEIEARDSSGRDLHGIGRAISHFAYQPFPGMFNWSSLATWSFSGLDCIGELQNTWHPDGWREFSRALLTRSGVR